MVAVVEQRQYVQDQSLAPGHTLFACLQAQAVMVFESRHAELESFAVDLIAGK
jgi:hypothetical protein